MAGDRNRIAWGVGLATIDADGAVLDAWYPELGLGELPDSDGRCQALLPNVTTTSAVST